MEQPDERRLIEAAQRDPRRFADLYEQNFDRVYAYVTRRVRDRAQAQDLTADVFHHALANLARFEWRGTPFVAWLYRIASNAIADHFGRHAREQIFQSADKQAEAASEEAAVGEAEHLALLFRFVDELPPDQGRIVRMRFAEERSIREIAREIGRTEGAVKQLQFRALQTLRARMRDANG